MSLKSLSIDQGQRMVRSSPCRILSVCHFWWVVVFDHWSNGKYTLVYLREELLHRGFFSCLHLAVGYHNRGWTFRDFLLFPLRLSSGLSYSPCACSRQNLQQIRHVKGGVRPLGFRVYVVFLSFFICSFFFSLLGCSKSVFLASSAARFLVTFLFLSRLGEYPWKPFFPFFVFLFFGDFVRT